jgi:hypothetical protein
MMQARGKRQNVKKGFSMSPILCYIASLCVVLLFVGFVLQLAEAK